MRKMAVFCAVSVALGGCATASKDVATAYVSPVQYQSYDCQQLAAESQRVVQRVQELGGHLDQAARNDAALVGVGVVLFWPALFALGGTKSQEAEYGRLKGEAEAVQQAAVARKCPTVVADPLQAAGQEQQPTMKGPEILGCVPVGTREGDRIKLADHGEVLVKKIASANTECGANGPTIASITASFVRVERAPARMVTMPAVHRVPTPQASPVTERLRELKRLRDENLITQDVYEAMQRKVLADQ